MQRVFFLAALFLFLGSGTGLNAAEIWRELTTDNFHLVGNTDEKLLIAAAEKFESFHHLFRQHFSRTDVQIPFKTDVVVVRNGDPRLANGEDRSFTDGRNILLISDDALATGNLAEAYHEYARFLLDNNFGRGKLPPWLSIGLAEYFAAPKGVGELLTARENNLAPLSVLFDTDYYTLAKQPAERKAIFRAQAWALVSCLAAKRSGSDFTKIEDFLAQLTRTGDLRGTLFAVFAVDLNRLETDYRAFLRDPKLQSAGSTATGQRSFTKPAELTEAQRLAVLGDIFFGMNKTGRAAELVTKSLGLDGENALALSTLSLIRAREFYYDEAEELAARAISLDPRNFLFHYRYAAALSRQGMTEYGFVSGYPRGLADKMRAALGRAIELDPDFTEAYALLCFVNYVRNEDLDESRRLIGQALRRAPGNQRYLLRLAEIDLRQERFTDARKLAIEVFRSAPDEQLKLYSQNTIQRIDSTEYQLARLRNEKAKYVNDDIVTDKPLTDEEIRRLREKATVEQIRLALKRPRTEESRTIASLSRIECGKDRIEFVFSSASGPLKLQARSFDGVSLLSFIEEMSDFRLGCGPVARENSASVIFRKEKDPAKTGEILSIEFVPRGFKLQN